MRPLVFLEKTADGLVCPAHQVGRQVEPRLPHQTNHPNRSEMGKVVHSGLPCVFPVLLNLSAQPGPCLPRARLARFGIIFPFLRRFLAVDGRALPHLGGSGSLDLSETISSLLLAFLLGVCRAPLTCVGYRAVFLTAVRHLSRRLFGTGSRFRCGGARFTTFLLCGLSL